MTTPEVISISKEKGIISLQIIDIEAPSVDQTKSEILETLRLSMEQRRELMEQRKRIHDSLLALSERHPTFNDPKYAGLDDPETVKNEGFTPLNQGIKRAMVAEAFGNWGRAILEFQAAKNAYEANK